MAKASVVGWIAAYFVANLALTVHNKWVLNSLNFNSPWLLTAVHVMVSGIGAKAVRTVQGNSESMKREVLSWREKAILLGFSALYTLNIAISNVGLLYVSLAFHQVVRSSGPVATVVLEWALYRQTCSRQAFLALLLVVVGVILASIHELRGLTETSLLGVSLTTFGVLLAALKNIATCRIMAGPLKLSPLHVLDCMMLPCTLQCLMYAYVAGEFSSFSTITPTASISLLVNGIMAFALNYTSFTASAVTGPLAMTVVANVKQAVLVALVIVLFDQEVGVLSAVGIATTLVGGALYSFQKRTTAAQKQSILPTSISKHASMRSEECVPLSCQSFCAPVNK